MYFFEQISKREQQVLQLIAHEYTIKEIPFCISADYKPLLNLFGDGDFPRFRNGGAISIRYVF